MLKYLNKLIIHVYTLMRSNRHDYAQSNINDNVHFLGSSHSELSHSLCCA